MADTTTGFSLAARIGAALIAFCGWLGLVRYLSASASELDGEWIAALWTNLGFFTDLTNLLLAVVMTGIAAGHRVLSRPAVVGWTVAAIATVGVGFWLIGGTLTPGQSALEDVLLHGVTPWAALLFWLVFAPKGSLRWRHPFIWLAWPAAYWTYAFLRGALSGRYAYPFMDPAANTAPEIALVIAMLTAVYLVWSAALVLIDRALTRRR